MEYTTSSGAIAMPAHYALVPQDEMVYLEGGALFDISKEQVLQFGVNVVVNGLTLFGGILFSSGVSMLACALIGTTSTTGRKLLNDFFSSLNPTQWVAFGFAAALGTAYGVGQAVYYYNALIDPLVKAFQEAFADAAASTTTPVPAAA